MSKRIVNTRMKDELVGWLDQEADRLGITRSALINLVLSGEWRRRHAAELDQRQDRQQQPEAA